VRGLGERGNKAWWLSGAQAARRSDFSRQKCVQARRIYKEVFSSKLEVGTDQLLLRRALSEPPEPDTEMSRSRATTETRQLRGSSARAVEFQLMSNALAGCSRSEETTDARRYHREVVHLLQDEVENHQKLVNERARNLTDVEKIAEPLAALSKEMKSYEKKSCGYFLEKRFGL
jgi:hypothetical protein